MALSGPKATIEGMPSPLLVMLLASAPVRLTGAADVVQLCRHLTGLIDAPPAGDPVTRAAQVGVARKAQAEALDQEYEVLLPPREFQFGDFDSRAELLDVGTRLAAGHGLLDLEPLDANLQLNAAVDEARAAYQPWAAGKGSLRVTFDLDEETTCEGSPATPPWLLTVHLLSVSFVDDAGRLVLDGANGLAVTGSPRLDRSPGISVQSVVALEGHVDPARVASSVQDTAGLQQCYDQALGKSPQLEGTVVFQAQIDGKGRPSVLKVALEDLGRPELVGCLGDSLRSAVLAGVSPGAQLLLPIELRRL